MKSFVIICATLYALAWPVCAQAKYKTTTCVIDHVDDGDTILCSVGRGKRQARVQFELNRGLWANKDKEKPVPPRTWRRGIK